MKHLETDIVVIAVGSSGLATTVATAEGGAKVITFEKASTTGGTGNMAMGVFAVESKLQRYRKIGLTKDEAFNLHMNFTLWRVDPHLVKANIDKSAGTIDWLEKLGVEFADVQTHNFGLHFTWHIIKGSITHREQPEAAATMMKILTEKANVLGASFFLRTPVKKILKKEGRVVGVIAEDPTGEEIQVTSKAVIIATGGFGDSPEMIKKHIGYEWGCNLSTQRTPGVTGDGITMAWEVGAAPSEMIIHLGAGTRSIGSFVTIVNTFRQPNLIVNVFGERFMNEEITQSSPFGPNAVAIQKDQVAFVIFDAMTKQYYLEAGLDFPTGVMVSEPLFTIDKFDDELKQILAQGNKDVTVADSIDELAAKIEVDPNSLIATIKEYNQACETGRDGLFNKNPKYLIPVNHPKFYACKLYLGGYGTLGGIKINHKTEVLSRDYCVIPGLYAAGCDANSINGDTYNFMLPGFTLGVAKNSGRIAGENAAKFALSRPV